MYWALKPCLVSIIVLQGFRRTMLCWAFSNHYTGLLMKRAIKKFNASLEKKICAHTTQCFSGRRKVFSSCCCSKILIEQNLYSMKFKIVGYAYLNKSNNVIVPFSRMPASCTQDMTGQFLSCAVLLLQLYSTLWDSMDCDPPASSAHGIL